MDTSKRSVAKAISFRVIATAATLVLVWILTGDLATASVVGVFDVISKLIIYYLHERAWDRFSWGMESGSESRG
jgi:uncharacterized membrane protein